MKRTSLNATRAGATLISALVLMASVVETAAWGGGVTASEDPGVRLLSLQIFWMDQQGAPAAGSAGSVRPAFGWSGTFASGGVTRALVDRSRGDAARGEAAALMLVPWSNRARDYYVVSQAGPGPPGNGAPRFETIIGTRANGDSGTLHTVNLVRTSALSRAALAEVERLVDLGLMGGEVYWEAAFELSGLHRDEIRSVEALGPGLIKPPKRWIAMLADAMTAPAAAAGAEVDPCLKIGPLSFCLSAPRLAGFLSAQLRVKERSRLRLTRSLWHAGNSCGVVVFGKMSNYSVLTFRVKTNGRGALPAGVRDLPPFDLAATPGWNGSMGAEPAGAQKNQRPAISPGVVARVGASDPQAAAAAPAHGVAVLREGAATEIGSPAFEFPDLSLAPRWSARIWGLSPPRAECYTPQGRRHPRCAPGRSATRRSGW